jgi:8-oxo-dGTP pyrophosphatase MutT (NUDIX family)
MAKIIISEPQNIVLGISFNEKKQLLVNLNKRKDGNLEWRIPGGKIENGLSSISSLSKEYKEELGRNIKIVGLVGKVFHSDARGTVTAEVYRTTLLGDFHSVTTQEPTEIIECRWMSRHEFPSRVHHQLDTYCFSPLSWKVVASICACDMEPWKNKFLRAKHRSYFV